MLGFLGITELVYNLWGTWLYVIFIYLSIYLYASLTGTASQAHAQLVYNTSSLCPLYHP